MFDILTMQGHMIQIHHMKHILFDNNQLNLLNLFDKIKVFYKCNSLNEIKEEEINYSQVMLALNELSNKKNEINDNIINFYNNI